MVYHPKNIESFWQQQWRAHRVFSASNDFSKPKYYALDMFPYPSAAGLHVGHPVGYTATDICARYYKMKGFNVLHPMGWDAFGLPAEQHAIETGENPRKSTERNIANFKRQLQTLGLAYDWEREIATCDPKYYKWTQWIFTKLFEKGLAYQAEVPVNWCPALKTVLANEEVIDGKSERGGHPVFHVPMRQWLLKITQYAERLLADLEKLDWPESTKEIQRNWIGKSVEGENVTYNLRDWIFSRQRYWGEPIPILKDGHGNVLRALSLDELPLTLPEIEHYEPTADGKGPLAAITTWVQRTDKNGDTVFVETDTMPGSAGSSWYFLRYIDPFNDSVLADYEKLKYWMPVDFYIGGQEHAVGHLLYARFWTKFLYDIGVSPVDEPFRTLVHQGMICRFGAKMSKSKGNGISPDEIVNQFGADSLRTYLMFMGPLAQTKEWDDNNLGGVFRFLSRIERHFRNDEGMSLITDAQPQQTDLKFLHKTIKKVTEDIENLSFNTAISHMMIFLNHVTETKCFNREVLGTFLKLLNPFAPHLTEDLWYRCILQNVESPETYSAYPFLAKEKWPSFDPALVVEQEITIGVQVNGKVRGEMTIAIDASQEDAVHAAYQNHNIKRTLEGKHIRKIVFVKNRILNFVVAEENNEQ